LWVAERSAGPAAGPPPKSSGAGAARAGVGSPTDASIVRRNAEPGAALAGGSGGVGATTAAGLASAGPGDAVVSAVV
ncbi:MAG: hypothetical protein WCP28_18230, partial [Actinomycetes bacterium]